MVSADTFELLAAFVSRARLFQAGVYFIKRLRDINRMRHEAFKVGLEFGVREADIFIKTSAQLRGVDVQQDVADGDLGGSSRHPLQTVGPEEFLLRHEQRTHGVRS